MIVTSPQAFLLIHLGLGALLVHGLAGGVATLYRQELSRTGELVRKVSAVGMAAVAWATAWTGTWLVYPGYRAPAAGPDLDRFPKQALITTPETALWHEFGMEWKEHVAWLTPFLATAVAYAVLIHPRLIERDARVRRTVATLFVVAFVAALVAGGLGAAINKVAPNDFLGGAT